MSIARKGVVEWNAWRSTNLRVQPDLTRIDLSGRDLRGIDFRGVGLFKADLSNSDLRGANLRQSILIKTNFQGADLTGAHVYGVSVWDINLIRAVQKDLVVTEPNQAVITVDNLEIAQFIYLLLNNEKIRDVLNTITTKLILILGRFTPDRKAVLDAIREELRHCNYLPVLFDFDKPATRDTTETVRTLAHLARFIIADITDPSSIPLELQAIVPDLAVPVQPLLLSGEKEFSMFKDLRKHPWVLPAHEYQSQDDLLKSLGDKVIAPAEAKAKELEKR